jgi:hypothetical protein
VTRVQLATKAQVDAAVPVAASAYLGAFSAHGAIEQACADAAAAGRTVKVAGTWHLTDKVDVLAPVDIDCRSATLYQDTYGLPAFEVRTRPCSIR